MNLLFVVTVTSCVLLSANGARILSLFPHQAKSHYLVFEPLLKKLSENGHQVVSVTHFPQKKLLPNFTDVDITTSLPSLVGTRMVSSAARVSKWDRLKGVMKIGVPACDPVLNHPAVKRILQSKEKFDVFIVELFASDCFLAIAHALDIPIVIGAISSVNLPWSNEILRNPENPSYVPDWFSERTDTMDFFERSVNFLDLLFNKIAFRYLSDKPSYEVAKIHLGDDLPDFDVIRSRISLILTNAHPAVSAPRALAPGLKQLGGIHIPSSGPVALPKDLEDFLDSQGKNGVIYFSLGSQIDPSTMPEQALAAFYRAFEQVPQQILWKCSGGKMPTLPKNVKCIEWAPQLSILCHPNVRLFITHGGMLGSQEAVYCGVPILGIPLFGDQHLNMAYFVKKGLAVKLDYRQLSYEPVSNALNELLVNKSFCPSLAVIADVLRLSDNIAGVTILAFGNGAPDIFTSLVSGSDEGIIMFTELIGAGVFVTAIIAGSVAVIKPFRVQLKPLMRDAGFYIVTVCWISYVVRDHTVHLWEAISFVLYYLLFISVVVIMQIYENREERLKSRIPGVPDPDILRTYLANKDVATVPNIPVRTRAAGLGTKLDIAIAVELERHDHKMAPDEAMKENGDRPKGLFQEFLYDINPIGKEDWANANRIFKFILIIRAPAMVFLQLLIPLVNTTAVKRGWSKLLNCFQLCVTPTVALFLLNVWKAHFGPVSVVPIFLLVGSVIGVIVFLMTHVDRVPKFHNVFAFLGFLAAMLMVYLIAGEVMAVLQCVGYAFSISDAMLGITFLAWGNSVGDLISNVAIARRGFPRMGYAACFGGPMFNTLLGLGLTYGKEASKENNHRTLMRMSDMAPGCLAFLLCSLITTIIYLNITGSIARKSYGYLLYSIYASFILIQFLSELRVIHPLGTDHRPD